MFEAGQVIISTAGHDKGELLVVVGVEGNRLLVCDGKQRPLEKPKAKNPKHAEYIGTTIDGQSMLTNRKIRQTLNKIANPRG